MPKTILITGSTDGIGLETAKMIAPKGHTLLLHGRSPDKLTAIARTVRAIEGAGEVKTYRAELSVLSEVRALADEVEGDFESIDVLINNAGVFKMSNPLNRDGYDARFIVNVVAPYLLTKALLPRLGFEGRVVNLSSAAQAPVDLNGFLKKRTFSDGEAYAQSKLALTMWSIEMARTLGPDGPMIVAVNPASFLGSKMAREAYGQSGHDLSIGADILTRAALSDEFADASGRYYDNDRKTFAQPHPDALDPQKSEALVQALEALLGRLKQ
ncbi:putative oxidoreductase [Candidatus Propionivibrio aalborgensis]|uniref:Putative oxidoreductase n=1 Tax=Candidatus Propionivibrio aalborgensis TaxID=1860101 RepID=A0A1A8XRM1_9RHOO|nr:SDR family NAD(P)-dependent oxidoreductase [Candidatus Propionivibrio aalborgensis]SBT06608.1 putative oxidoreductase [Candidatus Propionivibrio aalborgensis]